MNIVNDKPPMKFKDLPIGSVFYNLSDFPGKQTNLYLKIRASGQVLPTNFSREVFSQPNLGFCVNLTTNELETIGFSNSVQEVDATLRY